MVFGVVAFLLLYQDLLGQMFFLDIIFPTTKVQLALLYQQLLLDFQGLLDQLVAFEDRSLHRLFYPTTMVFRLQLF